MGDLISRKAVYEMLHGLGGCDASDEWSNGWDKAIDTAISELNEIPTAYDVDKVVERLEKLQLKSMKYLEFGAVDAYQNAIEIVKGGGQE